MKKRIKKNKKIVKWYILFNVLVELPFYDKAKKKKGLSHEPKHISMWSHFCRIAIRSKPNFWLFFLVARKKYEKNWPQSGKTHTQKKNSFCIAHFLRKKKCKQKKKCIALSIFGKSSWDKPFFFFFFAWEEHTDCMVVITNEHHVKG